MSLCFTSFPGIKAEWVIKIVMIINTILITLPTGAQKVEYMDSLDAVLQKNIKDRTKDSLSLQIAKKLFENYRDQHFEKASYYAKIAMSLAKQRQNKNELNFWYGRLAKFYMDYEQFSLALEYNHKARLNDNKLFNNNPWWQINLGNIYLADNALDSAIEIYKEALDGFTNSLSTEYNNSMIGISVCYFNLSRVYFEKEMKDSAILNAYRSMNFSNQINNFYRKTKSCLLLVDLYLAYNNMDSVTHYLNKAIEDVTRSKNKSFLPLIYEKKAAYNFHQNELKNALSNCDSVIYYSYKVGDTKGIAQIYAKKAMVYQKMGNIGAAIEQYKFALLYADSAGNLEKHAKINKALAGLYKHEHKLDSAIFYLEKYITYRDSQQNNSLKVQINKSEQEMSLRKSKNLEKQLKIKQQQQNIYKVLIFSGLIIFFMLLLFLYYMEKSRKKLKKNHHQILSQAELISSQYEEILQQNDALSVYKSDLEKLIAEKTDHLEATLLKAKESDRLKTAFLTNMSHEIRTPLNAIMGFTQLLNDEQLSEKDKSEYREVLIKSAEQLQTVIINIVELSKIEAGQIILNKTFFDINVLFQELQLFFTKKLIELSKESIKIEFFNKLVPDKKMLVADRNIVRQILFNLLDNSVKYTSNGMIYFGCEEVDDFHIKFFVNDTGIGIYENNFTTIFESFTQLDNEQKQKNKGVGLGLSISKGLVEKLNGKIFVESEKGKGSRFNFIIPCNFHKEKQ